VGFGGFLGAQGDSRVLCPNLRSMAS